AEAWQPATDATAPAAPAGLPAGFLAAAGAEGSRVAVRSGRRVPGVIPVFPGAGLVVATESAGGWRDRGFADEVPDADVRSAAVAVAKGRALVAYVIPEANGAAACRVVAVPAKAGKRVGATWRRLPDYPQAPGMAAPVSGWHRGALIVAGGTNWPQPGVKRWYDTIHVLVDGEKTWRDGGRLPAPRAYGAAVSLPDGVLVLGGDGGDAPEKLYQDAFFMAWDGQQVRLRPAPALPLPLTNPAAIAVGGSVYLAGGNTGSPRLSHGGFWRLDLANPAAGWQPLPLWPGPARSHAVLAELDGAIYLVGGFETRVGADGKTQSAYLADAYRYRPGGQWETLPAPPWSTMAAPSPAPVTRSPARLFLLGGVDGRQAGLLPRDVRVPEDIIYFDVARHAWRLWPQRWPASAVTIPAVPAGDEWIFASGEIKGGVRMTEVWAWRPAPGRSR
ncbi:MAG: hypothetical protein JNG83_03505, partial [Opitutaceae bacterium]|nr:hypothetical protein [Opitutaceae bacterium]